MSREIKFRYWQKKEKRILSYKICDWLEISIDGRIYDMRYHGGGEEVTDEYILMQFTGLHDKKGKEIYEGDILEEPFSFDDCRRCMIIWNKCGFEVKGIRHWLGNVHHYDNATVTRNWLIQEVGLHRLTIVGNIYENPELLESEVDQLVKSKEKSIKFIGKYH